MSEDKKNNLEEENLKENNAGHQGLSLGAILNESMQEDEVFDALAFLDSKPKKEKIDNKIEKNGKKKKKEEKKEPEKTETKTDKKKNVMDSLMEAAVLAAADEKNGGKEKKHEFLYKPEPQAKPAQGVAAEKTAPKHSEPVGEKQSSAKAQPEQNNPFKIPVPPPAHKKNVQVADAVGLDSINETADSLTSSSGDKIKTQAEKTDSHSGEEKKKKTAKKEKGSKKQIGRKKKLAFAFLVLLLAASAMMMLGRNGASNKPSDPSVLAMNKNSDTSDNFTVGYSENISDWIPKNSSDNLPDGQQAWMNSDAGSAMSDVQYPLGLEGQQGYYWRASNYDSPSSSDDDFEDFGGYSWRSSDYDNFDSSYGNNASSDYYSSVNFSFGGGMSWDSGGSGSMTSSSGGSYSGGSYSSDSGNDGGSAVQAEETPSAPVQQNKPGKKGRAVSGPDMSYSDGRDPSPSSNFEYKLQAANSAFGTTSDISNANYGSSFDQGENKGGSGGENGHLDAFSSGKVNGGNMEGADKGGLNMASVKNAMNAASGAPEASAAKDVTNEGNDGGGGGGSSSGSGGSGGGAGGSSVGASSVQEETSSGKNDSDNNTENSSNKESGEKDNKTSDKEKSNDSGKEKGNYGNNGKSNQTQQTASSGKKKCSGDLSNFTADSAGIIPPAAYQQAVINSGKVCSGGCGDSDFSYFDNSVSYMIDEECRVIAIMTGSQTEKGKTSEYIDKYIVSPTSNVPLVRIVEDKEKNSKDKEK